MKADSNKSQRTEDGGLREEVRKGGWEVGNIKRE